VQVEIRVHVHTLSCIECSKLWVAVLEHCQAVTSGAISRSACKRISRIIHFERGKELTWHISVDFEAASDGE